MSKHRTTYLIAVEINHDLLTTPAASTLTDIVERFGQSMATKVAIIGGRDGARVCATVMLHARRTGHFSKSTPAWASEPFDEDSPLNP